MKARNWPRPKWPPASSVAHRVPPAGPRIPPEFFRGPRRPALSAFFPGWFFLLLICGFVPSSPYRAGGQETVTTGPVTTGPVTPHPVVGILCFSEGASVDGQRPETTNPSSHGCGVVIGEGHVLTTRHLLGDPRRTRYLILLAGDDPSFREPVPARLLAADAWTDLAVLEIARKDIRPVRLAETAPRAGQPVAVIAGFAAGQPDVVASPGVIAEAAGIHSHNDTLYRFRDLIRIDTSRAGFTSGGAVLDATGQLVGLTTAMAPPLEPVTNHVAIPVDETFRHVVGVLQKGELPRFGYTGITPRELSAGQQQKGLHGIQVTGVAVHSPADLAGLEFADVITHWNGREIHGSDPWRSLQGGSVAGSTVKLDVIRGALNDRPVEKLEFLLELSRQRIPTRRTSFQVRPVASWRGLQVDYPSSISNYEQLAHLVKPSGCVVITSVQIGSAAWNAGLRPRTIVTHVGRQAVRSPESFYSLLNPDPSETVGLTVVDPATEEPRTVNVEWPAAGSR